MAASAPGTISAERTGDGLDLGSGSGAALPAAPGSVLRVVSGRLAGKSYPLGANERICIGHALANDVVLRGTGTSGTVLELTRRGESAVLRVLKGRAQLLGRDLETDDEAHLPPYLPFRFGEFTLAHGQAESERWDETARLAEGPEGGPATPLPAPSLLDRIWRKACLQWRKLEERVSGPRLAICAVSLLLLLAAAGLMRSSLEASRELPSSFGDQLAEAGIQGLAVEPDGAGALIVSGVVASESELAQLRKLAAAYPVPVMVDVTSNAALAGAAEEILHAQGIEATVAPAPGRPRAVEVSAAYMAGGRQDELRTMLKRDLPGLGAVSFRIDDALGGNPLQSFFARSGAGIATLVSDPGYIVTADGSRWFPGAVLPSGHRLISVGKDSVRLEKDGRTEELRL
ncbi:SctD/MshK family protein [Novosphingobium beihaiensis]|uniref:YscD/Y4YQ C-terminal domain-containing protein n=1 Tax=Novosphingobium beihaiensis TaxID=2930389 RepID=A0ABT0BVJ9_9SPHN|nr:hypothetical protein [Novosphingobium beihaiensis]MCJ2189088.1 hypothetical protein [Novosphingobium beihaiensis]